MEPLYLDYNATTPLDPEVVKEMEPFLGVLFGNPSSMHEQGNRARLAVEKARSQVAGLLNCASDEILFTSGGTESNNHALKGLVAARSKHGRHIITSMIEHPAVEEVCRFLEHTGYEVTRVPVDGLGMVDPDDVRRNIRPDTILITVMHANNETGVIQPVDAIGRIAREHGIAFHTDAAQSGGKIPVDAGKIAADLISLAGHKLYAPKGVGVLYIRRGVVLEKLMHGAGHERGLRAGTENLISIVGLGKACEVATGRLSGDQDRIRLLRNRLERCLIEAIPDSVVNGHLHERLPNTLNISFPGIDANLLLSRLPGIAASAGAACHAGSEVISPVLKAMNVPDRTAMGSIRFSLGRFTTETEIESALSILIPVVNGLRGEELPERPVVFRDHPRSSPSVITQSLNPSILQSLNLSITQSLSPSISHSFNLPVKLTQFTHSLGCACKIRPQLLEEILHELPECRDAGVLVGIGTHDDAAVYRFTNDTALVQTVDFIPPVVDDPYAYGAIAAANAISDIYAMGGTPLFALSIVGFPEKLLPKEILQSILRGAAEKAAEAGIYIVGGHTIDDTEPKFGLTVTGRIDPTKIWTNCGATPGDRLILTKPIGTGILCTAMKRNLVDSGTGEQVIAVMSQLNRNAAEIAASFPVHACTDVTGFGLMGHLKEMVTGSGLIVEINSGSVPVLKEALALAIAGIVPGGTLNNRKYVEGCVEWDPGVSEPQRMLLCDAQTSGGLLLAVPKSDADALVKALNRNASHQAAVIGEFTESGGRIHVRAS